MGVNPPRTFEEVIIPYLQHARQHQRSYETTVHRIKPLREYFAGRVVNDLGGPGHTGIRFAQIGCRRIPGNH